MYNPLHLIIIFPYFCLYIFPSVCLQVFFSVCCSPLVLLSLLFRYTIKSSSPLLTFLFKSFIPFSICASIYRCDHLQNSFFSPRPNVDDQMPVFGGARTSSCRWRRTFLVQCTTTTTTTTTARTCLICTKSIPLISPSSSTVVVVVVGWNTKTHTHIVQPNQRRTLSLSHFCTKHPLTPNQCVQ